ncbi:MAG: CehA/McbA family metallohydrolase [Candidatus Sumerlaeia bacterium]|nr:CehA/McbA family metallohydrolase [Candidatus Sumerlaeia bacterium]
MTRLAKILILSALILPVGNAGATILHRVDPINSPSGTAARDVEAFLAALHGDLYMPLSGELRSAFQDLAERTARLDEDDTDSILALREEVARQVNKVDPVIHMDFSSPDDQSLNVEQTIDLPSIEGSLILTTTLGDGPTKFQVLDINLATSGDGQRPLAVEATPGGTMVTLVRFQEIPVAESILLWQFQTPTIPGHESWGRITRTAWATTTVDSGPAGNLSLEITDEEGEETPALVRIRDVEGRRYVEPPNAIDLAPIMTEITGLPIYGPGKAYTHYIPGEFRGPFWIVPGGFEAQVPPGRWTVEVYKGYEHIPVRTTIDVPPGEWTRERITLPRWIDMPKRGWHSGDDHVHSRLVSSEDARKILTWAKATNVQVINVLEMGDQSRTWYQQRGFGREFRVQQGNHVLVPGQEDPRAQFGHFIALNTQSMVRDTGRYLLNDWMAEEIRSQGGLFGQTHVGEGYLGIEYDMALSMPTGNVDFASIMQNTLGTELYHKVLDLGFRLTASAGSDTPYGGSIGITRSYVYLGEGEPFDVDAWFEAFAAGRTFVTNGPMLEITLDEKYIPGDEVLLSGEEILKVHGAALGRPNGSAPRHLAVYYGGKTVAEHWNNDPEFGEITFELELPTGFGGWLAVEATGFDGSQGHTTPIYIVREGYRPWNHERAPELLNWKTRHLDEIEEMISLQSGRKERGEMAPTDFWNRYLVRQSEGIHQRIEAARSYYSDLERIWEEEASERGLGKAEPNGPAD